LQKVLELIFRELKKIDFQNRYYFFPKKIKFWEKRKKKALNSRSKPKKVSIHHENE